MYWCDWGSSSKIEKANMDGTARTTLVSTGLTRVSSLALDFKNKLLYWCDASLDLIERVDLQGNNRVVVLNLTSDKNYHPFGLTLYEDASSGRTGVPKVFTSTICPLPQVMCWSMG